MYVHLMHAGALGGQKRGSDSLEVELWATWSGCWEQGLGPMDEQQCSQQLSSTPAVDSSGIYTHNCPSTGTYTPEGEREAYLGIQVLEAGK